MRANRLGHRDAHTASFLARPRGAERPVRSHIRLHRTASSIWLPWLAGLLGLLSVAAATALLGGRIGEGIAVPQSVLEMQRAAVTSSVQQIRNGLEGGVQDLAQLAASLTAAADDAAFAAQVAAFGQRYRRYRAVFVVNEASAVVAQVGSAPHPQLAPRAPQRAGMTDAVGIDKVPVTLQYAPFTRAGKQLLVVAEYALARLHYALDPLTPATAWLVNGKAQIIASTAGFIAFDQLATGDLAKAANSTADKAEVILSQGGVDANAIIADVPVRDADPTPIVPGWRLVTSRSVSTIALPQTQARNQALLIALALTIVTIGVFGWMYVVWLRPIRRLVQQADRIADGDLGAPVDVRRYDELGLLAASLERLRVGLLRQPKLRRVERAVPDR